MKSELKPELKSELKSKLKSVKLIQPSREYLSGYLEACREFKELGLLLYSFNDPDEYDIWGPELFSRYENYSKGINLKDGYVPSTTYWMVDTDQGQFIGEGNIRHILTPSLLRYGGHIGYAIRASLWNKGYGTAQLGLLLNKGAELNISKALITCDDENTASQKVIEKNGGIYQDTIDNNINGKDIRTRRYWVRC